MARWQPLRHAAIRPVSDAAMAEKIAHALATFPDATEADVRAMVEAVVTGEVWMNNIYQVNVRRCLDEIENPTGLPIVHLSIKTIDKRPVRDWRDFQRIKNQLVGPECEGIELYPAESRLVDTANSYHLWVIAEPAYRLPFGWHAGRRVDGRSGGGAVQRPLDDETNERTTTHA